MPPFHSSINDIREFRFGSSYRPKVINNPFAILFYPVHLLDHNKGPGSVWSVTARMLRTEGFMSLMNGTSASILREGTYSTIRLGTYEMFKDL